LLPPSLPLPPTPLPSFFFNDTAPTEIYTLSLHDALPISRRRASALHHRVQREVQSQHVDVRLTDHSEHAAGGMPLDQLPHGVFRSEEHTSELQSLTNLVCRLLLEKKKTNTSQQLGALTHL